MTSPLTDTDLDEINARLNDLDQADEVIKRAKTAGLDVKGQEDSSRDARAKLQGIKGAFFPGR